MFDIFSSIVIYSQTLLAFMSQFRILDPKATYGEQTAVHFTYSAVFTSLRLTFHTKGGKKITVEYTFQNLVK